MKGAHLVLNEEILEFLRGSLNDVDQAYSDAQNDQDPEYTIAELESWEGWTKEKDNFGTKVYAARVYPVNGHEAGELRVTVVLNKKGALNLDIRVWGDY